jgi:hypothetical protein
MSELSEMHEKVNDTKLMLAEFIGEMKGTIPHLATKTFVTQCVSEHVEKNHNKNSIVPKPDNKLTGLIAKLVGAIVILVGLIVAILQVT